MKRTPWLEVHDPVRPGVYERLFSGRIVRFAKWDGKEWLWANEKFEVASKEHRRSLNRYLPWRGVEK